MANPRLTLWVDPVNNNLLSGWGNNLPAKKVVFKQGDTATITIRKVEVQDFGFGQMKETPMSTSTTLTVGNRNLRPVGGNWTLTYDGYTTDFIPHNAPACEVAEALNASLGIALAGGVTVSQLYGDTYKVVFNNTGVTTALTGNGIGLMPQSDTFVTTVQQGSPTAQAVFLIVLRQGELAEQGLWEVESACEASVNQINAYTWEFFLTKDPKGGFFVLSIDAGEPITIPVFSSETEVQLLFGANYTVTQWGDYCWRVISNDLSAFSLSLDSDADIISFEGITGTVAFTGSVIQEALSSQPKTEAFMEIAEDVNDVNNILLNKEVSILAKVNR